MDPGSADAQRTARWTARIATAALCIFGAKVFMLISHREVLLPDRDVAALVETSLLFGQDVLLVAILALLLGLGAASRRRGLETASWILVAAVVLINCLLTIAGAIMLAHVTPQDPLPYSGQLARLARSYGSSAYTGTFAATLGLLIFFPPLCRHRCGVWMQRYRRLKLASGLALGATILYVPVSFLAHDPDAITAFPRHRNATLSYVMAAVAPSAPFDRSAPPATPEEAARLLTGPASAAGARETPTGIPELLGQSSNVVLVIMESVGAAALNDGQIDLYPFLKGIRRQAVSFRRHQTPAPFSTDALVAIFCGLNRFPRWPKISRVLEACRPLPAALARHGVRTGFFHSSYFGDWLGADFWAPLGFSELVDATAIIRDREAAGRPVDAVGGRVKEHETASELIGWIERRCEQQEHFFATYYPWVPHAPYPASHAEGFVLDSSLPPKQRYLQLIRVLDAQIGRIHAALSALDCGRPFVMVLVGDHGEAFREHPGNIYHGSYVYQENLSTPLLVVSEAVAGRISDRVTTHLDLGLTLADLLVGGQVMRQLTASGPGVEAGSRPHTGVSLLRPGPPRAAFAVSATWIFAVRFGQFKYMRSASAARLFDTDRDPQEQQDLRSEHPELTAAMEVAVDRWISWVVELYSDEQRPQQPSS
jgi:Sulfatase